MHHGRRARNLTLLLPLTLAVVLASNPNPTPTPKPTQEEIVVDADFFQHLVRFMEVALRRYASGGTTSQAQRAACLLPY